MQNDGFFAVWTGGDDGYRCAADFFDAFQICFGIGRQCVIAFHAKSGFAPAGHGFVNRFAGFYRIGTARQDVSFAAVGQFVADADIDGFNSNEMLCETFIPLQI